MNILLINPFCGLANPVLPLGLAYLAAVLERKGVRVSVIDAWACGFDFEQLARRITSVNPQLIGVTMMSPNYALAKQTIETANRCVPSAKIVVGGPHPSALPRETLEEIPEVDFIVIGEGEVTFPELVEAIMSRGQLKDIAGLAYRENSSVIINPQRQLIADLDSLPSPRRELFPLERYRFIPPYGRYNPASTMVTSRGCPFSCIYCSKDVFKNAHRALSPVRVVDEIEQLVKKYRTREIRFYDDDFTLDMRRAQEICDELLSRDIRISWTCTTRVDLVNEELLKKMKRAGCWMIAYGVESGVQEVLDQTKKGYTVEQVRKAFALTRRSGIRMLAYFMLGLPGESREMIEKTIDFSIELAPDFANYSILVIYPGSALYKDIVNGKYGKLKDPRSIHLSFTAPQSAQFPITRQSSTFIGDYTLEELERLLMQAHRRFYLRGSFILKHLRQIRSPAEFFYYTRSGINLVKWLLKSSD